MQVWLSCLASYGYLFVEWSRLHGKAGFTKSDCFAASKKEYTDLLESVGHVRDIIEVKCNKVKTPVPDRTIFVVERVNDDD